MAVQGELSVKRWEREWEMFPGGPFLKDIGEGSFGQRVFHVWKIKRVIKNTVSEFFLRKTKTVCQVKEVRISLFCWVCCKK